MRKITAFTIIILFSLSLTSQKIDFITVYGNEESFMTSPTGMDEIEDLGINFYPNPSRGLINVESNI